MTLTYYDLEKIGISRVREYIKSADHDRQVAEALEAHSKNKKVSNTNNKTQHRHNLRLRRAH
jgi:hypothetical protein